MCSKFSNENDVTLFPITFEHIQRLLLLNFYHKDPFDRIIIAQALSENINVATIDDVFNKYGVNVVWD